MKFFWILSILVISCTLIAQPQIIFDNLVYDFGRIEEEGGPHLVEFKFSNNGDEPLRVIDVVPG